MSLLIDLPQDEKAASLVCQSNSFPHLDRGLTESWPAEFPISFENALNSETETESEIEPSDDELLVIRCPLAPAASLQSCPPIQGEDTILRTGTKHAGKRDDDWFELALQAELPAAKPVLSSWGDDDEDTDEEIPDDDAAEEEDEPDPFEDFDEDDFDDDFDDDFEEELEDEYEIEPQDDGFVIEEEDDSEIDPELLEDGENLSPAPDEE